MKNSDSPRLVNEILQLGYHSGIWLILALGLIYFALV